MFFPIPKWFEEKVAIGLGVEQWLVEVFLVCSMFENESSGVDSGQKQTKQFKIFD